MKTTMAVAAILFVLALTLWLNRFRYQQADNGATTRINRFSGQICYSQSDGTWNSNQHPTGFTRERAESFNTESEHVFAAEMATWKALVQYSVEHHLAPPPASEAPDQPTVVKADVPNTCK